MRTYSATRSGTHQEPIDKEDVGDKKRYRRECNRPIIPFIEPNAVWGDVGQKATANQEHSIGEKEDLLQLTHGKKALKLFYRFPSRAKEEEIAINSCRR